MMYHPYYTHGGFFWLGGLFSLLVVVALVAGVILVVRQLSAHPHTPQGRPDAPSTPLSRAVEELDLRYARGEIERTEYLQRRADLMHGAHPMAPPPGPGPAAPPQAPTPPATS